MSGAGSSSTDGMSAADLESYARRFREEYYRNLINKHYGGQEQEWLKPLVEKMDLKTIHYRLLPKDTEEERKNVISFGCKYPEVGKANKKRFPQDED